MWLAFRLPPLTVRKAMHADGDRSADSVWTRAGWTKPSGVRAGTDEEIASFCQLNHGVTFPLMKKSDVNGDNTNEVFKWLKEQKSGLLGLQRIKVRF